MSLISENPSVRRLELGVAVLATLVAVGVLGYSLAGWQPLESLYFVIITIFGIGFEEVHDIDTPNLQIFTIFMIVAGTSAIIYSVGGFLEMVTQGEIKRAFEDRRKTQGIEKQHDHVIICGFGRMGQILARELRLVRKPFVVVDNDEERARAAEADGYLVLIGDATDEDTLISARIGEASIVATVLPNDAKNVFITLSARNLNPKLTIIARGELPRTEAKLRQAGADHVVLPAAIGGHRIANMIKQPESYSNTQDIATEGLLAGDLRALGVYFDEMPIAADSSQVGKPLSAIHLSGQAPFLIVGLKRKSGETVFRPPQDTVLKADDVVILMGAYDDTPAETS